MVDFRPVTTTRLWKKSSVVWFGLAKCLAFCRQSCSSERLSFSRPSQQLISQTTSATLLVLLFHFNSVVQRSIDLAAKSNWEMVVELIFGWWLCVVMASYEPKVRYTPVQRLVKESRRPEVFDLEGAPDIARLLSTALLPCTTNNVCHRDWYMLSDGRKIQYKGKQN